MDSQVQLLELFFQINRKIWKKISMQKKNNLPNASEMMVLGMMHKKQSCRVTELAGMVGLSASTLTGILDRLVVQKYLERINDPDDRRSVIMKALPKVGQFFRRTMADVETSMQRVFQTLSPERVERLVLDLKTILECLEKDEGVN